MGNNPSSNARQPAPVAPTLNHDPGRSTSRREPRSLNPSQRTTAAVEVTSLAQAHGTTSAVHRTRTPQPPSHPYFHPTTPSSSPSHTLNIHYPSDLRIDSPMGAQQSKDAAEVESKHPQSKPVDVPLPASSIDPSSSRSQSQSQLISHSLEPSGPSVAQDMSYHLTRPPRLPLPIEEEVHTPGSPIIAPADLDGLNIDDIGNDVLPRRSSALSNTTIDEEDAEELRVDKTGATVPTTFEWKEGGEKVYVTGTIFQWNKKHRLHPVEGQPGILRALIHVRPGTHHIRFIVDSLMQCSKNIPTTVDFGNNLVNYIEVSADDLPRDRNTSLDGRGTSVISGDNKSQVITQYSDGRKAGDERVKEISSTPRTKVAPLHKRYCAQIPQYLIDLDKAEDTNAYQYAAAAIEKLPTPPSLPGFLGKPILNAATPMKDDNSVLTMPNHTVLNHLATSSIKNNVLAVSATTRYKRKYVTTIMYKPTGDD